SGEQERFAQLGFTNEPKRCGPCRQAKKASRGDDGGGAPRRRPSSGGPREMFSAVCAQCGKQAQVPFQPRGDKPVYCSDCFGGRR
ncbi:MAG TPA: CxxC-x17-CxxC domain-containing protein, partial [Planctomycetota bacterium]|nr:CxxC-x17-CxxC domain-containing protein [Planctomycetota bacterium]